MELESRDGMCDPTIILYSYSIHYFPVKTCTYCLHPFSCNTSLKAAACKAVDAHMHTNNLTQKSILFSKEIHMYFENRVLLEVYQKYLISFLRQALQTSVLFFLALGSCGSWGNSLSSTSQCFLFFFFDFLWSLW